MFVESDIANVLRTNDLNGGAERKEQNDPGWQFSNVCLHKHLLDSNVCAWGMYMPLHISTYQV